MIVYFNGDFIPKEEVKISPDDRGFLFGDGVYEVISIYNGRLFKAKEHFKRLQRSIKETRINFHDTEKLGGVSERLIKDNKIENAGAMIYIQITRGVAVRKHSFPGKEVSPTVYACILEFHLPQEKIEKGVKVILVPDTRWKRCDIKAISLLPNVLANQQAIENGAEDVVLLRDGFITEGSHNSFCAVFNGELFTHPKDNCILPGVTRDVISNLCGKCNIPFNEVPILEKDLKKADECMLAGTGCGVLPVVQVDDWQVGDGKPGPITKRLHAAFNELIDKL